jgi:hypothetical protein
MSRPTVDLWLARYAAEGIAGLLDHHRGGGPRAGACVDPGSGTGLVAHVAAS